MCVRTVFLAHVFEAFGVGGCVVSTPAAGYTAVTRVICVVGRNEADKELMLSASCVGYNILPFGGVVLWALREPCAVPGLSMHSSAVKALCTE